MPTVQPLWLIHLFANLISKQMRGKVWYGGAPSCINHSGSVLRSSSCSINLSPNIVKSYFALMISSKQIDLSMWYCHILHQTWPHLIPYWMDISGVVPGTVLFVDLSIYMEGVNKVPFVNIWQTAAPDTINCVSVNAS